MQKNYKHYIIKSTANNKRYKLYNKDEPNIEIFMSPYLSDVMAYIKIEEDELYVADEFNIVRHSPMMKYENGKFVVNPEVESAKISTHTINPDRTPEKAAIALEQLNSMAAARELAYHSEERMLVSPANDVVQLEKASKVVTKTSMKMKKKA